MPPSSCAIGGCECSSAGGVPARTVTSTAPPSRATRSTAGSPFGRAPSMRSALTRRHCDDPETSAISASRACRRGNAVDRLDHVAADQLGHRRGQDHELSLGPLQAERQGCAIVGLHDRAAVTVLERRDQALQRALVVRGARVVEPVEQRAVEHRRPVGADSVEVRVKLVEDAPRDDQVCDPRVGVVERGAHRLERPGDRCGIRDWQGVPVLAPHGERYAREEPAAEVDVGDLAGRGVLLEQVLGDRGDAWSDVKRLRAAVRRGNGLEGVAVLVAASHPAVPSSKPGLAIAIAAPSIVSAKSSSHAAPMPLTHPPMPSCSASASMTPSTTASVHAADVIIRPPMSSEKPVAPPARSTHAHAPTCAPGPARARARSRNGLPRYGVASIDCVTDVQPAPPVLTTASRPVRLLV